MTSADKGRWLALANVVLVTSAWALATDTGQGACGPSCLCDPLPQSVIVAAGF